MGRTAWTAAVVVSHLIASAASLANATVEGAAASTGVLSGSIVYYAGGAPVPNVTVTLSGAASSTAVTDASGQYSFSDLPLGTYTVTPSKNNEIHNAVSALDASMVLQGVIGSRSLSPSQALAADVTGDGTASALDASLILQKTLGLISSFPLEDNCQSAWVFQPNLGPGLSANPFRAQPTCSMASTEVTLSSGGSSPVSFEAIALGDVTGNWKSTASGTDTVKVAVAQFNVITGDPTSNLATAANYAAQAKGQGAQILVLPELFDTGYANIQPTTYLAARPIPGETTDAIGVIAKNNGLWISAGVLEQVPGGVYDTLVVIDAHGDVVHRQRKGYVGPVYGDAAAFQGNLFDVEAVSSPWGDLVNVNCAEGQHAAKLKLAASKEPTLTLWSFANPSNNELDNDMAPYVGYSTAPVVGANQIFTGSTGSGGTSRCLDKNATVVYKGDDSELVHTMDVTIAHFTNRRPIVDAGEVQTIRLPMTSVFLQGYAVDDAVPNATLSTSWSKVSGPGAVTFVNASALRTTAAFSSSGVYRLRLSANDGTLMGTDDVTVNVLPTSGDLSLAGYWTFDGTANDASGSGNNGIINGNPAYSTDAAPTAFANSRSLALDGAGDYVSVPYNASLDAPTAVTMAMWVKPADSFPGFVGNGGNDWVALINKGDVWGLENYMMGFGAYYYTFGRGMGAMFAPALDNALLTPGVWYHVAVVLDAIKGQGKIFINGVLDHVMLGVGQAATNTAPLRIGTFKTTSATYHGKIDDVRLWTRPLSESEVAALVPGATVNALPVADAGPPRSATCPARVGLQGTFSDDRHPSTSSIATAWWWKKVSGPADIHFDNAFSLTPIVELTHPGTYVFELTGSDGAHRVRDTVVVTCN